MVVAKENEKKGCSKEAKVTVAKEVEAKQEKEGGWGRAGEDESWKTEDRGEEEARGCRAKGGRQEE